MASHLHALRNRSLPRASGERERERVRGRQRGREQKRERESERLNVEGSRVGQRQKIE